MYYVTVYAVLRWVLFVEDDIYKYKFNRWARPKILFQLLKLA